jgi:hypothetical protein
MQMNSAICVAASKKPERRKPLSAVAPYFTQPSIMSICRASITLPDNRRHGGHAFKNAKQAVIMIRI